MNKRIIRLNESKLYELINEAVKEALTEMDKTTYQQARKEHPKLMDKIDPRTFQNREKGINAQGRKRNDNAYTMKMGKMDNFNRRIGAYHKPDGSMRTINHDDTISHHYNDPSTGDFIQTTYDPRNDEFSTWNTNTQQRSSIPNYSQTEQGKKRKDVDAVRQLRKGGGYDRFNGRWR